jgi:outer membrane protein
MTFLRSIRILFACFTACLLFNTSASAQSDSSYKFSLKQAIDYALSHQTSVLNAQIDERIAQQKVNEVRGIGLPQVNGSVDVTDYLQKPKIIFPNPAYGMIPLVQPLYDSLDKQIDYSKLGPQELEVSFVTKYNFNAGVSISQLVFDGGYIVGLQATKTYLDLSKKMTARTKIEVVEQVTKAYYAVLVNEKNIGLLDANITRLRKIYSDTKALNEAGFAEKLDVDRLQVALNNLEVTRNQVESGVRLMFQILKFQMGMPVQSQLTLTDTLSESFAKPEVELSDPGKRIEYSLLQSQRQLHELDLKRNRYGYLPSLAAYGSLGSSAQRNEFDIFNADGRWFKTTLIGAKLSVPIFDGLQKNARIQTAKLNIQKTENDLANLRNGISLGVNSASVQYENAYRTLELQRNNLDLAREVVRVTQIKYNEGVGSNIEVINAETSLREAQTNYFQALYTLMVTQIDLRKAQGTLYE